MPEIIELAKNRGAHPVFFGDAPERIASDDGVRGLRDRLCWPSIAHKGEHLLLVSSWNAQHGPAPRRRYALQIGGVQLAKLREIEAEPARDLVEPRRVLHLDLVILEGWQSIS